jgi:hypothetical protein
MAIDPRKRQKKQERRAAKRKSKQRELVQTKTAGIDERLTVATKAPILDCWVTENLWTQGMGYVGLSRQLPDGSVALALFLVDRYCLGVKNALVAIEGRFSHDSRMRELNSQFASAELSAAAARKLVEGAVDYARALGFAPHPDYHKAKLIFGDIDARECLQEFEFGKDGKPFFIAGPHDGPARCRQIVNTLVHSRGANGFHFMVPFESGEVVPSGLDAAPPAALEAEGAGPRRLAAPFADDDAS